MKDLLDKLSSYNVFNYLLPGILFAAIGEHLTSYTLLYVDIVLGVFVYYFYGLVISRIGSLIFEPLLKWMHIVQFAKYKDFVSASKVDGKIVLLSEINNMYRTLISVFFCLLAVKLVEFLQNVFSLTAKTLALVLAPLLIVLFVIAYRKQTNYIKARIANALNPPETEESEKANDSE